MCIKKYKKGNGKLRLLYNFFQKTTDKIIKSIDIRMDAIIIF